jgi:hypothetical protein
MSREHAKREMVTGEKPGSSGKKNEERTPSKEVGDKNKEHKEESAGSIKSHRKGDKKKKKMKKVVYYETDSSSPSTFGVVSTSSKRQERRVHNLTSLHESIWDIVEFGAQAPHVGDEDYDSDEGAQIRHFNSQATSILLASLCQEEYNMVQGLKSAKEIWDILKMAHEGDEVTKITKRETIEG